MNAAPLFNENDLSGQVIVVAGGTGNVGEGIVRAALGTGATVVVPSRTAERLKELIGLIDPALSERLHGIEGPYGSFETADELANKVLAWFGRIDHVVAVVGGWWGGKRLWEIDESDWEKVFIGPATTHMALVRAFAPRIRAGGTYTTVAGFSSMTAYPGAGLVSMQGAAQLMMREVLAEELAGQRRVNELMLGPIINRNRPYGDKSWLSADQVGSVIVRVLQDEALQDRRLDIQDLTRLQAVLGAA